MIYEKIAQKLIKNCFNCVAVMNVGIIFGNFTFYNFWRATNLCLP